MTFLDQKPEQDNVKIDKVEETIFVRRTEEPKKVAKAEAEPPPPSTPEPEPTQNLIAQKFSQTEKKVFLAILVIVFIALTFFLLGYYL